MPKTKWMSVKDGLPDEGVDVLVLGTSGWMEVKHYDAPMWYPGLEILHIGCYYRNRQ